MKLNGKMQHETQGAAPEHIVIAGNTPGIGAMGYCPRCGEYKLRKYPFRDDFPYCVDCYAEMRRNGEMQDDDY